MLLVTLASVIVPWWLWHADQTSHSLHFQLVSQTSLQPDETDTLSGLKLSLDGVDLQAPYLSVFELINDGSKPVTTSDFESPIELSTSSDSIIARAQVTKAIPKDLKAELVTDKQSIKIKPLLLNPKDALTLAVITSGKRPQFSTRARIAGITSVPLEMRVTQTNQTATKWLLLLLGFLLFISAAIAQSGPPAKGVYLRRRSANLVTSITTAAGSLSLAVSYLTGGGVGVWPLVGGCVLLYITASLVALVVNREVSN